MAADLEELKTSLITACNSATADSTPQTLAQHLRLEIPSIHSIQPVIEVLEV